MPRSKAKATTRKGDKFAFIRVHSRLIMQATSNNARFAALMAMTAFCCLGLFAVVAVGGPQNGGQEAGQTAQRILGQGETKAEETSRGCTSCHTAIDSAT